MYAASDVTDSEAVFSNGQVFWRHPMRTNVNSGFGRTNTNRKPAGNKTTYSKVCTAFQHKIASYKTLCNQAMSTTGKYTRPKPATLNSFANWINKGAIVQTVSCTQIAKWAKSTNCNFNTKTASPTSCKTVLCKKFGKSSIKAVCRTSTGNFMVATTPNCKGRGFTFPC